MKNTIIVDLNYEYESGVSVYSKEDFYELIKDYIKNKIACDNIKGMLNNSYVFHYKIYGCDKFHYTAYVASYSVSLVDKTLKLKGDKNFLTIEL